MKKPTITQQANWMTKGYLIASLAIFLFALSATTAKAETTTIIDTQTGTSWTGYGGTDSQKLNKLDTNPTLINYAYYKYRDVTITYKSNSNCTMTDFAPGIYDGSTWRACTTRTINFTNGTPQTLTFDCSNTNTSLYPLPGTTSTGISIWETGSGCNLAVKYSNTNTIGCGGTNDCHYFNTNTYDLNLKLTADFISSYCGDNICNGTETNANCPNDCPATNDLEITDGPTAFVLGGDGIIMTWSTNLDSTTKVNYGLTTGYGDTYENATLLQAHQANINGLTVGTWHFQACSTDGSLNEVCAADLTLSLVEFANANNPGWTDPGGAADWDVILDDAWALRPDCSFWPDLYNWGAQSSANGLGCLAQWVRFAIVPPGDSAFDFLSSLWLTLKTRWPLAYITDLFDSVLTAFAGGNKDTCPLPDIAAVNINVNGAISTMPSWSGCDAIDSGRVYVAADAALQTIGVMIVWVMTAITLTVIAAKFFHI